MQSFIDLTLWRIQMSHNMLVELTELLSEAHFSWVPGPHAPPIGWHLWHMARWTDRMQAAWPTPEGASAREIWVKEHLDIQWELDTTTLGVLQTGMGMTPAAAWRLVHEVGRTRHLAYARRCFVAWSAVSGQVRETDPETVRTSVRAFRTDEQKQVIEAPARQVTVADDLLFHLHHAGRHVGMVEGLLGAQGLKGTASA